MSFYFGLPFASSPLNLSATATAYSPYYTNGSVKSPVLSGVTATGIYNPQGAAYPIYKPYSNPYSYSNPYLNALFPTNPSDGNKPDAQQPTAAGVSGSPVSPQTIDYLNAELAKHYGMSAETAYQEALANTSYQRAIKDMQAAGLNPAALFGSGKGSGADGVSYVSSATTGSGPSGGTTAKSNSKGNLFSQGAYYGLSSLVGLGLALLMKNPTGYWIGQSAAQGAMGAANAGYKSRRYT